MILTGEQHTPPLYIGSYELQPTDSYLCALNFVMNPQSTGTVTLNSADPSDAPIIDPRLASHPYDRRVLIEGYRKLVNLLKAPVFAKDTVRMVGGPEAGTDEEIWVCFSLFFFGEFEIRNLGSLECM